MSPLPRASQVRGGGDGCRLGEGSFVEEEEEEGAVEEEEEEEVEEDEEEEEVDA